MIKFFSILIVLLITATSHSAEIKVELGPIPEWQKPIMNKITFGVKLRTLHEMLNVQDRKDKVPIFLVFTAKAAEDLGKRLLWVDAEVEFSNGTTRKFKNVNFHLLTKGIGADVKKLDDLAFHGFVLFGDALDKNEGSKPTQITKLKITNPELK